MAHFYSHLIKIETLVLKLEVLGLENKHNRHLTSLVDDTIHQAVLERVLSKLPKEKRRDFLVLVAQNRDTMEVMTFLNGKIDNVEKEIMEVAEEVMKEFLADIEEAERLKL
ncbi:MAG: hypothetical protein Q7S44_04550 [bacterium]|nr:hypothetical protein [bacterium]